MHRPQPEQKEMSTDHKTHENHRDIARHPAGEFGSVD